VRRGKIWAAEQIKHAAEHSTATLDELLLSRFVRVAPGDFDVFLERQRAAEAAGYARLA
jgi:hypothetical protein